MKTKNIINILYNFTFIYIIIYAFFYSIKINLFEIDRILITGNKFLDNQTIEKLIYENIKNKNIYDIKINDLSNKLDEHSFIQRSKIYTTLPSTLAIVINEINPIILYEDSSTYYLIDEKLNKIKADINAINFFSVPILSEYDNLDKECNNLISSLIYAAKQNSQLYNSINEIKLKDNYMFLIIDNTVVKIQRNNIKNNMIKLIEFIEETKTYKNINSYKYINLTIPNQIIVKDKTI